MVYSNAFFIVSFSFIDKTKEFPVYVMEYSHSGLQDVCVCIVVFFLFDKVVSYVKTGFCCEIVRFKLLIFFGYDQVIDVPTQFWLRSFGTYAVKKTIDLSIVLFFKVFNQSGTLFQIQLIYTIIIYMYNRQS